MNNKQKEFFPITLRALTAAIPYIGGSVNSIWSDIMAKRKEERFIEFVKLLEAEIKQIKYINSQFITHDEFLDIFENISKHIVDERGAVKRILYKNLILSAAKDTQADFDIIEKYIRILESMATKEALILKIFYNPQKFNSELGSPVFKSNENAPLSRKQFSVLELLELLLPEIKSEDILDSLDYLERNRLVATQYGASSIDTNGNPISFLDDKITRKGINFVKYILNEN